MNETYEQRRDAGMYERALSRMPNVERAPSTTHPAPVEPQPRREDTGRFEARERPAGREPEGLSVHDAAIERAKEMQTKPIEVHKSGLDEKTELSVEQAAKRVEESRDADANQAALDSVKAQEDAVDKLRAAPPEKQPQLVAEPDIETVLKHPKITAALAERVTAAETQLAEYELGLENAWRAQLGAIGGDFPELANLPHQQWAAAINAMAQREPQRARQIVARLHSLGQLEAAALQLKAQKEARERSEFANYTTRETQRFQEMTKGIAPQRMAAIKAEIPNMLASCGVSDPRSFLTAIQGQTVFPRASAEMIMMKAAMYDMAMKAPKPQPTRAVLPVQRPGVAGPRVNPANSAIQALNARLSATGDIKDATKLLLAKRTTAKRGR